VCYIASNDHEPPMSTTTIRLPDDLRERVAAAAERAGTTAHNFILSAIAEKAELAEREADFRAVAEQRYASIAATGRTIPWAEMRDHLDARLAGRAVAKPRARKLAR
jgi:predicted transcriptional regulator